MYIFAKTKQNKNNNGHYMSQKTDVVIFWRITRRGANNVFVSVLQYSDFINTVEAH